MPRERGQSKREPNGRDLETIQLALDENGAPVTLQPAAWYVCFVPGLKKQWWHWLFHETPQT